MQDWTLQDQFYRIKPVTRYWLLGVVVCTFGAKFGAIPFKHLVFDVKAIFYDWQLWRIVLSFFWLGKPNISWLINLFMLCVLVLGGGVGSCNLLYLAFSPPPFLLSSYTVSLPF